MILLLRIRHGVGAVSIPAASLGTYFRRRGVIKGFMSTPQVCHPQSLTCRNWRRLHSSTWYTFVCGTIAFYIWNNGLGKYNFYGHIESSWSLLEIVIFRLCIPYGTLLLIILNEKAGKFGKPCNLYRTVLWALSRIGRQLSYPLHNHRTRATLWTSFASRLFFATTWKVNANNSFQVSWTLGKKCVIISSSRCSKPLLTN